MAQFDAPNDIYHNGVQYNRSGTQTSGVDMRSAATTAKVMTDADMLFTLTGPIQIISLMSLCVTANDATASTLQYKSLPTVGTAATISGATGSLASAAGTAGTSILLTPTALTTAPVSALASAGGVQLGLVAQNHIIVQAGTIGIVIGTGPTTGTWQHFLQYIPLAPGAVAY